MKVCISPRSLKLLATYFNSKIPDLVKNNKTYNQIFKELYEQALSDFSITEDLKADGVSLEELILQHTTILPQLIHLHVYDPIRTEDFSNIKSALERDRLDVATTIQSNDNQKLKTLLEDFSKRIGNDTYEVPVPAATVGRWEAVKYPLYTVIHQEGVWDEKTKSYKLNLSTPAKQLGSKIQLNIINSNNANNLTFQLVPYTSVIDDPNFVSTLSEDELKKTGGYVMVLVQNGSLALFDNQGNLTTDTDKGNFIAFPIKTQKKSFANQRAQHIKVAKQMYNMTEQQAEEAVDKEIDMYLNWLNDAINKINTNEPVTFTVDLSRSSTGIVEFNMMLPTSLANIANINSLDFTIRNVGSNKVPQILLPNYEKQIPIYEKPLIEALKEDELDLLVQLITDNTLKINGQKITQKERSRFISSYIPTVPHGTTGKVGFEIKYDMKGQVTGVILAGKRYTISTTAVKDINRINENIEKFRNAFLEYLNSFHVVPVTHNQKAPGNYSILEGTTEQVLSAATMQNQYVLVDGVPNLVMKPTVSFGLFSNTSSINQGEIFRISSIENNELSVRTELLREYIIKNSFTDVQLDSENNMRTMYPYVAFNPIMPNIENNTPDEEFYFQSISEKSRIDDLQKGLFWSEETLAEQWMRDSKWLDVLTVAMKDEFHTKGPQFLASFIGNTISLWKGSNKTDLYHEVFHAYFRGLLTETERQSIYKSLRSENKGKSFTVTVKGVKKERTFAEATELELEEFLAEEFRRYSRNRSVYNKKLKSPIARFFQMLKELLEKIFGKRSYSDVVVLGFVSNTVQTHFKNLYENQIDISKFVAQENSEEAFNSFQYDESLSLSNAEMHKATATMQVLFVNYIDNVINPAYANDQILYEANEAFVNIARLDPRNASSTQNFQQRFVEASKAFTENYKKKATNFSGRNAMALQKNPMLLMSALQYIRFRLEQMYKQKKSSKNIVDIKDAEMLKKALDNYGDINLISQGFENIVDDNTTLMGIFLNEFSPFNLKGVVYESDEKDLNPDEHSFDKTGTEKSVNEDLDKFTKYLLSTLYHYERSGSAKSFKMSSLGVPKLHPLQKTLKLVMQAINNKGTTDEQIYEALSIAAEKNYILKQLVERLGDPLNPNITDFEIKQWGLFLRSVAKADIRLLSFQVEKIVDEEKGTVEIISKVGKTHDKTNQLISEWDFDFETLKIEGVLEDDSIYSAIPGAQETIALNPDSFQEIWGEPVYWVLGNEQDLITKAQVDEYKKLNITTKSTLRYLHDPIGMLQALGIDISSNETILDALKNGNAEFNIEAKYIQWIFESIVNRENAVKPNQKYPTSLKQIFNGYQYKSGQEVKTQESLNYVLTQIANMALRYDESVMSFMEFTADGQMMSTKSFHSSVTIELAAINNVKNYNELLAIEGMEHWNYEINPEVSANLTFVKMFNLDSPNSPNYKQRNPDITFRIENLTGSKVVFNGEEKGVKSIKSDEKTKFNTDFVQTLEGKQEVLRSSDKSMSYVMPMPIKKNNEVAVRQGVWINNAELIQIYSENYKGQLLFDIFKGHIESELLRINRLNNIQKRIDSGETVLFDPAFLERGKDWFKFSLLLSPNVKEALLDLNITESFTLEDKLSNNKDLINKIEEDLKDYFGYRAMQLDIEKRKSLVVSDNLMAEYKQKNVEENEEDIVGRMMKGFIINNYIQNLNMSLFLGDPANYGVSNEDFHKRLAGKFGTGRAMRHSQAWYNYVNSNKFERDGFSKRYFESLSEQEKIDRNLPSTYQNRIYSGYLETAIIKEAESNSIYREHYNKLLGIDEKKYSGMQEADGAAYVTFDTFRLLSRSHEEWSQEQEDLYQAIIKGEAVDEFQFKATFPVRKYQLYGPTFDKTFSEENKLQLMAYHKYAVIPLVPSLIQDTPMQSLHEMMMEQGIDYVTFQTGSKLSNVVKINKENGAMYDTPYEIVTVEENGVTYEERKFNRDVIFTKNKIHVRHLKSVAQQSEGYHGTISIPSQERKIALLGLFDQNKVPLDFIHSTRKKASRKKQWDNLSYDEKLKASDNFRWSEEYIQTLTDMRDAAKDEIIEDFGLERIVNPETGAIEYKGSTDQFLEYLKKELTNKNLTAEEISFIKDPETNELIKDLSFSLNASKIEEVFIKLADDKIRKLESNGEHLVQVPGTMLEKTSFRLGTEDENFVQGNNGLSTYYGIKEDGSVATELDDVKYVKSMQVKISLQGDFKKLIYTSYKGQKVVQYTKEIVFEGDKLVERFTKTIDFTATLKTLNEAIKDEEWLSLYGDMLVLPATRVPTSEFSMLESAQVVEFLNPSLGPIIILPSEIVAKSGSDFDIDKLFTLFPNIVNINGSIEPAEFISGIKESRKELAIVEKQAKKAVQEIRNKIKDLRKRKQNIYNNRDNINAQIREQLDPVYKRIESLEKEKQAISDEAEKVYNKEGKYKKWTVSQQVEFHHGKNGSTDKIREIDEMINYLENQIEKVSKEEIKGLYKPLTDEIKLLEETELKEALSKHDVALRRLYGKSRKAFENKLISLLNERITNPKMFKSLAQPNSTDLFSDLANELSQRLTQDYNKFDIRNVEDIRNGLESTPVTKESKIANSTIFDYRYNLLKHQENSKGKEAIGIAAIVATYYALFTQFGATLKGLSPEKQEEYNKALYVLSNHANGSTAFSQKEIDRAINTFEKYGRSYTIKFPHQSVDNKIALGFLENVDGKSIQTVIGQLINGFVDVAKKPWVFNIQGNLQNIPQMLLMVMSGMKVEDVVYFSSLPLVMEYNNLKAESTGIFSNLERNDSSPLKPPKNKTPKNIMINKYLNAVLDALPAEYNIGQEDPLAVLANMLDPVRLAEPKYLDNLVGVSQKEVEKNIVEHFSLFAHYLQIEEMAGDFTGFTMATKFDTQKPQSFTEYQDRITEIIKLRSNEKSSIPFQWYDELVEINEETGRYNSMLGVFNNDQFVIDLFSNKFPIRNHEMMLKKQLSVSKPKNIEKAQAFIAFKDDFGFFLYQEAFFRKHSYDNYTFVPSEEISIPIEIKGGTILFNPQLTATAIFNLEELIGKQFPTTEHYLRYRVELEKIEKEISEIGVTQFMDKYYYVENSIYKKNKFSDMKTKLALWRSRNNVSFFDTRFGIFAILKEFKKKHPDLELRYQLIADLKPKYYRSANKTNIILDNLEDPLLVKTYKEDLADLKNSEYPEVAEFFQLFDHLAILQGGGSSSGITNLSRIIDQNLFRTVIEEEIGFNTIIEQLDFGSRQYKSGKPLEDIKIPLLDNFIKVWNERIVPNWNERKRGINLMIDQFELESVGIELNNLSSKRVIAYSKFDDVEIPHPILSLENLLIDNDNPTSKVLDVESDNLSINWEFIEKVRSAPVAVLYNNQFLIEDEQVQEELYKVLDNVFGITYSNNKMNIGYTSLGQTKDNISIALSEDLRNVHSRVDESMANKSTVAIGKETEDIAKPSVSTSYANEINRLYPEKLASTKTKFKSTDKVWIFGSSIFKSAYAGKMSKADWTDLVYKDFQKNYVKLIDKALAAGVTTFHIGSTPGIDQMAVRYLEENGFYAAPVYTEFGKHYELIKIDSDVQPSDPRLVKGKSKINLKEYYTGLYVLLNKTLEGEINKLKEDSLSNGVALLKVEADILHKLRSLNRADQLYIKDMLLDYPGAPFDASNLTYGVYASYLELSLMKLREEKLKEKATKDTFKKIEQMPQEQFRIYNALNAWSGMPMNMKDESYRPMRSEFRGKSTMELIISGDRTRTTRSETEMKKLFNNLKDIYGINKLRDAIGLIIPISDDGSKTNDPKKVFVRITNIAPFTQEYQEQTWQKEGWEKYVTDKLVGVYPYAVEFELVSADRISKEDMNKLLPCKS